MNRNFASNISSLISEKGIVSLKREATLIELPIDPLGRMQAFLKSFKFLFFNCLLNPVSEYNCKIKKGIVVENA